MKQDVPKFQLQSRPTKRISVNDALSQNLFSLNEGEFKQLIDGEERKFLEAKTAKHGVINSQYWLNCLDDDRDKISKPLNEFDRSILDACISAEQSGLQCITLRGIWRNVTGKNNPNFKLTPALKKEILERVDRLASIRLIVDISVALNQKLYVVGTKRKFRATLLPCEILESEINGQIVDAVIIFNGESPLVKIAKARSGKKKQAAQILTYPTALLDVPNQRHTPTTAAVTNYLVRRVEIAKSHNTTRTILFSTLLERCGLSDATRRQRQETRQTIKNVMKSLVNKGEIHSFQFVKEHGEFAKITFNFD